MWAGSEAAWRGGLGVDVRRDMGSSAAGLRTPVAVVVWRRSGR